ncbi:MAG: Hsp20/alpha crystallin family protein [Acidobacteria bacterium]|nr:Hsp20/alpha crystallin family protein [Acidobacteriota bacterium]
MTLVRWDPIRELASMEVDRLNRMFTDFYGGSFSRTWVPAVDVFENAAHEYVIKAELPEVKREDIAITFDNGVLTLSGERTSEVDTTRDNYHRIERQHGTFTRSFTLPASVDPARIEASYKDGVLTVRVPKREEARPKQIEIKE